MVKRRGIGLRGKGVELEGKGSIRVKGRLKLGGKGLKGEGGRFGFKEG